MRGNLLIVIIGSENMHSDWLIFVIGPLNYLSHVIKGLHSKILIN